MTTAAELGIEAVTYIIPNLYDGHGKDTARDKMIDAHPRVEISLPRVRFLEKDDERKLAPAVGRHDDGFTSMVTPIGARPHLGNKKFSPKSTPIVLPKPAEPKRLTPKPAPVDRFRTNIDKIIDIALIMFGCTKAELKGRGHAAYLVNARLYVTVRLRNEYGLSTPHIGRILDRDHTSIMNLLKRAEGIPTTKVGGVVKRRRMAGSVSLPVDCVYSGKAA